MQHTSIYLKLRNTNNPNYNKKFQLCEFDVCGICQVVDLSVQHTDEMPAMAS